MNAAALLTNTLSPGKCCRRESQTYKQAADSLVVVTDAAVRQSAESELASAAQNNYVSFE